MWCLGGNILFAQSFVSVCPAVAFFRLEQISSSSNGGHNPPLDRISIPLFIHYRPTSPRTLPASAEWGPILAPSGIHSPTTSDHEKHHRLTTSTMMDTTPGSHHRPPSRPRANSLLKANSPFPAYLSQYLVAQSSQLYTQHTQAAFPLSTRPQPPSLPPPHPRKPCPRPRLLSPRLAFLQSLPLPLRLLPLPLPF